MSFAKPRLLFDVQKAEPEPSALYKAVMDWYPDASPAERATVAKVIADLEVQIAAITKQVAANWEKIQQVTEATVRRAFDREYRSYDGVQMDTDAPYVIEVSISPMFLVVSEDGEYG